jgi:predicted helicase
MNINQYLETVNTRYKSGISSEHTFRTDIEQLIRALVPGVELTNEPLKITDCGNPDFVITKRQIPIGFIEAKDIGKDLNSKTYQEQFTRYKKALDNLIITDYLWFQFFQDGELVHEIRIAEVEENAIKPLAENFAQFTNLIQDFCTHIGQTIKSSKKLAKMMAGKAKLLQNILESAITSDEKTQEDTSLKQQYETFKSILIHDLTPTGFADIYAQTLAYGMFAARLHDTTLDDFSRQEAAELIPKSNPFLRQLFSYVAGPNIDERIKTTVDNLADVFRATNVEALLHNFGKSTQTQDPIIHFYEDFLSEYDPKLRKARGVWYTPEPVVKFIVRAVDDILKSEFNLPQGLADTSKICIKQKTDKIDARTKSGYVEIDKEVHKVQILDPATGTGTFLAEVVKFIYSKNFKAMQGAWSGYVEEHLIPRLNGFELLMASYSMAHLKLDMLLIETGYKASSNQRFNIYLTNSLEEHHPDTGTIFSTWLSSEANQANHIKRDTPVMCVIGNPPYSVSSSNKSDWIQGLLKDYKKDLNERNIQPLSDDYIKFIRYGQYYIEKNGEGILAYISNNSFIDGLIHRQMRKSLLESFDKIYILNLHGDSRKKEKSPDGSKDQNVFDIMAGVTISFFIKNKNTKQSLASLKYYDLFGSRVSKYETLMQNSLDTLNFEELKNREPEYFFIKKDFKAIKKYNSGFLVSEIFNLSSSGIKTHRDGFVIDINRTSLENRLSIFFDSESDENEIRTKYNLKDNRDWNLKEARNNDYQENCIIDIIYRPFDVRKIYYNSSVIDFDRKKVMKHYLIGENCGLIINRQFVGEHFSHISITQLINSHGTHYLGNKGQDCTFPLYLYSDIDGLKSSRIPNLDKGIIEKIKVQLNLTFTNEKETTKNTFAPIDILDYIYAVLHSPTYREKYKEFLKIDFPRVPYPKDTKTFWQLVKLGGEIRQIHLLESPKVEQYITNYPQDGDNIITRKLTKTSIGYESTTQTHGKVWINDQQYFDNVPLIAWNFYIGGYQPAQKWLKDRKNRELKFEDILHYQKIIVALSETDRIMQEIDKIEIE